MHAPIWLFFLVTPLNVSFVCLFYQDHSNSFKMTILGITDITVALQQMLEWALVKIQVIGLRHVYITA